MDESVVGIGRCGAWAAPGATTKTMHAVVCRTYLVALIGTSSYRESPGAIRRNTVLEKSYASLPLGWRAVAQLGIQVEQKVQDGLGLGVLGSEQGQHALAVRSNIEAGERA
jgi:hypothetical protein